MTITHELKTAPDYFERVWTGEKTFEVRLDDRGYQAGDHVRLQEYDRKIYCECPRKDVGVHGDGCPKYSGREITARIGFVLANVPDPRAGGRGFNGFVVFSLCDTAGYEPQPPQPTPATVFTNLPLVDHPFEAFEGSSGYACTAMITLPDGSGDQCGRPASLHRKADA